jgi:hypothetical protein
MICDAAASDETYEELLARALTAAQDTAMRDKRRALGRRWQALSTKRALRLMAR